MTVPEASGHTRDGSASIEQPDYWWHRARAGLLHAALGSYLEGAHRLLDVGSADGPSVAWMSGSHQRFTVDLDPRGLTPGTGVCASALALPFDDATFDVVGAFDVVEHCPSEEEVMTELVRVLEPGGQLLLAVPAYQWAWTDHDVRAGHYRRYTRPRLVDAVARAGLDVERATYGFAAVFPFFAAQRLGSRAADRLGAGRRSAARDRLPRVSPAMDRLLTSLCAAEARTLPRRDLPVGSSVFLAARKR